MPDVQRPEMYFSLLLQLLQNLNQYYVQRGKDVAMHCLTIPIATGLVDSAQPVS